MKASILLGALFFWTPEIFASNPPFSGIRVDTAGVPDSADYPILESDSDTIIIRPGDVVATPDEEELKSFLERHSPHKATIYSAVLPGLGQIYNRKYWKVPLLYAIGYGMYSGFGQEWGWKYFNDIYQESRAMQLGETEPDVPEDQLKDRVDWAREKRDYITIWMGILYFANVVDAMADAYFYYYDISDDLSMQIKPSVSTTNQYVAMQDYSYGFKVSFKF